RPDLIRVQQRRYVPACRRICRSYPQGREARQSASPAADRVRAGHQSQDRQSTRSHCAGKSARTRRRGDRVNRRAIITLLGGAAAWPIGAGAQQPAVPVIGFLSSLSQNDLGLVIPGFLQGLNGAGFIEGRSIAIEYRWAEGDYQRLPELAGDLVNRKVAVIA